MCGIWGAVNLADEHVAERAARAIHHRGPDDHGVFLAREPVPVSLANTRLSIIDLSEAGHQPMSNEDGRLWIVYNGEVYNYQPLRSKLIEAGHQFRSHTDTEVILHAYEEWGEKCLEQLRGMFAFAIWDMAECRLFAARDRLGIKPLYYTLQERPEGKPRLLMFASELKALLATGLLAPRLNYPALHHYLSFYSVPAPYTMLDGVEALPAGHFLTFQDDRLTIKQYWSIPPVGTLDMGQDEIIIRLRELLEESIRLRMIADVPVGAFLSGGIDSSAVVALMTRISGERLRTFSIGFGEEGQRIDERSDARVLAEYYGTDHTEVVVSGRDVRDQLERIIAAMDQPSGDGLNTYLVSQAAARHVKVALSGLGGDELFAGYPQFKLFRRTDQVRRVWGRLPQVARVVARGVTALGGMSERVSPWLEGDLLDRYGRVRILFDEDAKLALYGSETMFSLAAPETSLNYLSRYLHPVETDSLVRLARLELSHYMAHTLLRDTDAMSMAHSLEVRVPLIDHRLVEFAVQIPSDLKLRGGQSKWIFIQSLRDVLPPEVLTRPKRGFEMPVGAWMRNELREIVEEALSPETVKRRGLFRPEQVGAVYQSFLDEKAPYLRPWALVVLELWLRQFVDNNGRPVQDASLVP
jgi:asparagine synthase (glutamine-hydrolysing)